MSQLGRISGPLLKKDLIRNGVDLAFETNLLYLDVNNKRIGINVVDPLDISDALTVNGVTRTSTIDITGIDGAVIGDITISGDTIQSNSGVLNLIGAAGGSVIYQSKLLVDDFKLENNIISTTTSNASIELRPHGSGTVDIFGNTNVTGNITATGNISAGGDIQIGSTDQSGLNKDTVTFNAEINSDLIPEIWKSTDAEVIAGTYTAGDSKWSLGDTDNRWKDLWVKNLYSDDITVGSLTIDGINLALPQGNILYVADNGSDVPSATRGTHQNDPFASIKEALSNANSGETVYIYPGTYTEIFPLTVPVGVTVKGSGIRSVKIVPTVGTNTETAFLLNGETTVEDLTIADFYSPGYAFKFAPSFTVSSRSPYVRNISVLTKGTVITPSDPLGFASADAGKGAFIDGSIATVSSKEASMLFHSVTFICPGVDVIVATNGTRVEWLNSFTYYANRSMYLYSSADGFAGNGKTRIKIVNKTGTWAVGNTLSYYDTNGTTVLASGVIESIDGDFYNIDGRVLGFEQIQDRAGKTITVRGNAKLSTAVKKFGTASLALDGTGDYLSVASQPDFLLGTDNWTIELWVYKTGTTGGIQQLIDFRTIAPTIAPTLYLTAVGTPTFNVNAVNVITAGSAVANNTWTHIAVSKSGTSTKMFINGTQTGSTYTDNNNYIQGPLTIGARYDGASGFLGYLDDVRISKGVARYTTTFPVPTTQLTGDLNTVLLITLNGANNSTAIADNGITLQDLRTSAGGRASIISFADYSDFGVEVRSIGSAAVYGNYGIYGDGVGVIAYLIGQNLAYIGNGKDTLNDPTTVVQANEIVELNNAKIYYQSVDHKGDFRIGDLFYVNQATGEVSFTNSNVTIGTSLTFDDGAGNVTFLDASKIETGDFRISGNTIQTLTQEFNLGSASNLINLQSDVHITGSLDVVGNVTIGGNITIGDQTTDTVSFVAGVNSDILPTVTNVYNLGSPSLQWKGIYSTEANIGSIRIDSNVITTIDSNANLELRANGTGKILIPNNNVQLDQNLTVDGTTNTKDINVTGTITHVGNVVQTGSLTQTGNINVTGTITVSGDAQFNDVLVSGNSITTTIGSNDLNLSANGSGKVIVPIADVTITNDLTVNGLASINSFTTNNTLTAGAFSTGDILISQNNIATTQSNSNLELLADGNGIIYVPNNNVQFGQTLTVVGTTNTAEINVTGTITQTGDTTQTGNTTQTGDFTLTGNLSVGNTAQFKDVKIDNNVISTTIGNNDLNLTAHGTGQVVVPTSNVTITNDLTVNGVASINTFTTNNTLTAGAFSTGDILISQNNITTTQTNSNLVIEADGSGQITVPTNNVYLSQQLTVVGTTNTDDINITGTLTQTGNVTQTGNTNQTGDFILTGNLTVSNTVQFTDIKIDNNVITTTTSNADLDLRANGTGRVLIPSNNVQVNQTLTIDGTTSTTTINNTGTVTSTIFTTGDISVTGNTISTTVSNSNLELLAAGTGKIYVPTNNVQFGQALTVVGTTTLDDTNITGTLTHVGATTQTGDTNQTGNFALTGNLTVGATAQFTDIKIDNNVITTTTSNADLDLRANGTGRVLIPSNNVQVNQTLTVVGTTSTTTINNTGTVTSPTFSTGDIVINSNLITTSVSNSNLELQASGTGRIYVPSNNVQMDRALTVVGLSTLGNLSVVGTVTHTGNTTQIGNVIQTGSYTLNGNLTVGATAQFNNIKIDNNVITTTIGNNDLELQAAGTGRIFVPTNNVVFGQNLTVTGTTTTTTINNSGTVTAATFTNGNIAVSGNTIQTTITNSNLQLQAAGTGFIELEQFEVQDNTIRISASNTDMVLQPNGTGIVSITSTQALKIPVGNNSQRPVPAAGMIRYNDELSRYEGYNGTTWVRLDGVEDADGNTKITAELTPGANDNTIRFYTNGTLVADLNATRFNVNNIDVDSLNISGNTISTTTPNTDLVISPNGTGSFRTGNFSFKDNTITNIVNNSVTIINSAADGYVKINSTGGFVIPSGLTVQRPPLFAVGMMRYNIDPGNFRVEIWNGSNWVDAGQGASGGGVSASDAQDIGILSAIIFG